MAEYCVSDAHIKDIIVRMKNVFGVYSDKQLADHLRIHSSQVSLWKSRQSIPFAHLYNIAIEHRVSIDWLLFGRECRKLKQGPQIDPETGVVPEKRLPV